MTRAAVSEALKTRISVSAIMALVIGVLAVIALGVPAIAFAFGAASVSTGLLAREKLRHDEDLRGVAPSMLGVLLGAVALFFTAVPVLLTFSTYLQSVVSRF